MGRLDGKVAFITGAARGQGRSHASFLAREGASIIAVDICEQIDSVNLYKLASKDDLAETNRIVAAAGGSIVTAQADVRSSAQLNAAVDAGLSAFGRIDICIANAGILTALRPMWEHSDAEWQDVIDVNLTGAWRTVKAVIPSMISQRSGSIILTSSASSTRSIGRMGAYIPSKSALTGLMRELAQELGSYGIRVNTMHPGGVATAISEPFQTDTAFRWTSTGVLPVTRVEVEDISNGILYLASDESRYVTGTEFRVDAGWPLFS